MKPALNLGSAALLVADGLVLGFAGSIISALADFPGATWMGVVMLLGNLAAAFFAGRPRATAGHRETTMAVIFVTNAALLAAGGLYIGQADDAPGAALIGFVLVLANLLAGGIMVRQRFAVHHRTY